MLNNCCYVTTECFINVSDQCICDIKLGGILAICDGTIYRRIAVSDPCAIEDFVVETFEIPIYTPFSITDGSNTEVINNGDDITFDDQNGVTASVSGVTNYLTVNGLTIYGSGVPSAAPSNTGIMWFYVDTTNTKIYAWDVPELAWYQVGGNFTGNPKPVANFDILYRALTVTVNSIGSSTTQVGNSLSYAWSVSPSSGVTISTPTASTTNITVTNVDEYTITLIVTDTTTGLTATKSRTVMLDRIINVGGHIPYENTFTTAVAAKNYHAALSDVATNGIKYRMFINGNVTEHATAIQQVSFTDYFPYIFFNGTLKNAYLNFTTSTTGTLEKTAYVAAKSNNYYSFISSDNFTISGVSKGYITMASLSAINIFVDNISFETKASSVSGNNILSYATGNYVNNEIFFNCNFFGTYGGFITNHAGSRGVGGFMTPYRKAMIYNCYINCLLTGIECEDTAYILAFHNYCKTNAEAFNVSTTNCLAFNNYLYSTLGATFTSTTLPNSVVTTAYQPSEITGTPLYFTHNYAELNYSGSPANNYMLLDYGSSSLSDSYNRYNVMNYFTSNMMGLVIDGANATQSGGDWLFGKRFRFIHNYIYAQYYTIARWISSIGTYPTLPSGGFVLFKAENNTFKGDTRSTTFHTSGITQTPNNNTFRPYF